MAHPLTQQPPSSIPFGSASRPSPLAFGFGQPSSVNAFASQSFTGGNSNKTFGFGSSPSKKLFTTPRPNISLLGPGPSSSLKRSRRSSTSSESASPPPTPSHPYARPRIPSRDKDHGDLLADVGGLVMKDDNRRMVSGKLAKRARPGEEEVKAVEAENGVDLGVLLATLPPTAHLSILLKVLQNNPHLTSSVLSQVPQPEMGECLQTLSKHMDKFRKVSAGNVGDGPDSQAGRRLWMRIESDVASYCLSATTYLNYFTSTSSNDNNKINIQPLLHAVTSAIYEILSLVPTSTNPNASSSPININHPASAKPVLDLANLALTKWGIWVENLSKEVNIMGGMYPHSTVLSWINTMDELAALPVHSTTQNTFNSTTSWGTSAWSERPNTPKTYTHPLVESFRQAFSPTRDKFIEDLGWLVGRHPQRAPQVENQTPFGTSGFGTGTGFGGSRAGGIWGGNAVLAGGRGEDEEL